MNLGPQAGRTFNYAQQNPAHNQTMDDEDAHGLRHILHLNLLQLYNSVEGMEVVCQEFEATSKDPEGHSVDELITEFSSSCLSAKENNAFDATSSHLTELEANEVVNDGDMEFLTDVESTSRIDARDQASELVLVDGKQDGAEVVGLADEQNSNEPDVLENNGVIGVGVNENDEGSKGILEDVPEVNKKAAHVIEEITKMSFNDAEFG
ncbi:hypothetical protein Tco_1330214 [Tanacetum coccineum]